MPDILLLLSQIAGILVTARLVGRAVALIGQPRVVGEMLAGIMLGPSLLGWAAPELFHQLFPPASLGFLNALSQIGLVFFMFLIGLELDLKLLRGQGRAAVITSHASIIAPFFLGACLALFLYPRLSDDSVGFTAFALFLGAAMSVTAFPVLARMLTERGMLQDPPGIGDHRSRRGGRRDRLVHSRGGDRRRPHLGSDGAHPADDRRDCAVRRVHAHGGPLGACAGWNTRSRNAADSPRTSSPSSCSWSSRPRGPRSGWASTRSSARSWPASSCRRTTSWCGLCWTGFTISW